MELVDPSCFDGLSEDDKQAQLYLAYYTWAGDDTLLDPDCFLAYPHREEVIYAALHVQGGTVEPECIEGMAPEERYQAMYEAVYSAAADDTLTHPDCFLSLSPEVRDLAFYTALYIIADDVDLVSPECFLGSSREDQRAALYAAVYQINQEPVDPIAALNPIMWLRADALELEDEDPVGLWPDVSGNGNDATQATFQRRPIYVSGGIGGLPSLQFDGIDDWLSIPLTTGIYQYFAVFKSSSATWQSSFWGMIETAVDTLSGRYGLFTGGGTDFWPDPLPLAVVKNGSDLSPNFDCGTITTPMILGVTTHNPTSDFSRGIGQLQVIDYPAAATGHFMLAEIIAFDAVQSPEAVSIINQHYSLKYGITLA